MRRRNLPNGGYGKVIWMSSRDLITRRCGKVTLRRGRDVVFYLGLAGDVVETY